MARRKGKRVVVVGAGFAGLNVAKRLQDEDRVTVVAPGDFVYVPLVHELLSENVQPRDVTVPLQEALPRARLVRGLAERVEGKVLILTTGERIAFDALVVALGAEPNDYGVPGVREHALTFANARDALRANARLKLAAADAHGDPVRVVVAGASFTGVEVAGEAAELLDKLDAPRDVQLLDALPEIFPRQSATFRGEVRKALSRLDLGLRTGEKIAEVLPHGVRLGTGEVVPADVVFWCAGVRPRRLEGVAPEVDATLRSRERPDVWICGDAARFPKEMAVPLLAQTAEAQARLVAHNVRHPERPKEYAPDVRGLIVSVGHRYAVAELAAGRVLTGEIPWHVKRSLYKAKIALT